jgi:hypothetical protein
MVHWSKVAGPLIPAGHSFNLNEVVTLGAAAFKAAFSSRRNRVRGEFDNIVSMYHDEKNRDDAFAILDGASW